MAILDNIAESCRYLLINSPEAEPYLTYLSGRINSKMQEEFSFGYFPGVQNLNLLTAFVDEKSLKKIKLINDYIMQDSVSARVIKYCYFENHPLILPYRDVYGDVVGLIGRTLLNDEDRVIVGIPKYKNSKFEKGNHVFGLYEAKSEILKKDFVYVVEGQFDVIKAREKGIYNIVAIGSSNITTQQIALISRYTKNVFLLLDNDTAGERGRAVALKKFSEIVNINNVYLPLGYKDIDEYLKDNNGDSLPFTVKNVKYNF